GQDRQYARRGESFVEWLQENLPAFLDGYLKERIPVWIEGKQRDFVPKMTTAAGRRVAATRIERLSRVSTELVAELEGLEEALEDGRLAVVRYFMEHRDNPRLTQQLGILEARWAATQPGGDAVGAPATPAELLRQLRAEVAGDE